MENKIVDMLQSEDTEMIHLGISLLKGKVPIEIGVYMLQLNNNFEWFWNTKGEIQIVRRRTIKIKTGVGGMKLINDALIKRLERENNTDAQ